MTKETQVQCPTCKKTTLYSRDNPSRPFCSERCKLIDLGEWASGGYSVAGNELESDVFSGNLPKDFQ